MLDQVKELNRAIYGLDDRKCCWRSPSKTEY